MIYELLVGQSPFHTLDDDFKKLYSRISEGIYEIPEFVPPEATDIIQKLLKINPQQRLGCNGIKEIKEHPFFDGINWEEMLKNNKKGPLNVKYEKEEIKLRALNVNFDEIVGVDKQIELDNFSFNETARSTPN